MHFPSFFINRTSSLYIGVILQSCDFSINNFNSCKFYNLIIPITVDKTYFDNPVVSVSTTTNLLNLLISLFSIISFIISY